MTNSFLSHFKTEITPSSGLDKDFIQKIEFILGYSLPNDYKEIVHVLNGFEGSISNSYIVFWPANDLVELNEGYGVNEFAPGILLFGSDGGNQAFGYDLRDDEMKIITIPLMTYNSLCTRNLHSFQQRKGRVSSELSRFHSEESTLPCHLLYTKPSS